MSLFSMTVRRIKKIVAWILALAVIALLALGGAYLWTVV